MLARDVMTCSPATVEPSATLDEARYRMRAMGVRHLPVIADGEGLVGIISMRDLAQRLDVGWAPPASAPGAARTTVAGVMSEPVVTVAPDTPLGEIARLMVQHHVGAVPVVAAPSDNGDSPDGVVGIVSYEDLLRSMSW